MEQDNETTETTSEQTEQVSQAASTEQDNSQEIIERLSTRRDSLVLENAKLRAILGGAAKDLDIDAELAYVGGLSVEKGEVQGQAAYRPALQPQRQGSQAPPIKESNKATPTKLSEMSHDEILKHIETERKKAPVVGTF